MNKINIKEIDLLSLLEPFEDVGLILSNDVALNVVNRLHDKGIKFNELDDISKLEYLFDEETILLITKAIISNEVHYYVEDVYGNDRLKSIEDNEVTYVENDLLNEIEMKKYISGKIVIMNIYDNDDIIPEDDEDYEESEDIANDLEAEFESIVEETLEFLEENQDEDFCLHCVLKDLVAKGYMIGYKNSMLMMKNALEDNLDNM
jgi:hypothetical protein